MSRYHRAHKLTGRRWERFARSIKTRDGWRCCECGRAGRLEVDHRVPLHLGGAPWDPDNCQALCRGCHFAKTAAENRRPVPPEVAAWDARIAALLETGRPDKH